jgi:outer membrane protein OmpA-like peptidoglycan-associated protein
MKARLVAAVCLALPIVLLAVWLHNAKASLQHAAPAARDVPIASASEDEYCSPRLKQVLRRVAGSCGLLDNGGRGCKPADAKVVAALSGNDFNALFKPLMNRARIIQFDPEQMDLDLGAQTLIEETWGDQRGASFFFVVARASSDGATPMNQKLSEDRATAVLKHLETKFQDPDLKREIGLLWLGEEYAQLPREFCNWKRSRDGSCSEKEINRSAFVAWIDCSI